MSRSSIMTDLATAKENAVGELAALRRRTKQADEMLSYLEASLAQAVREREDYNGMHQAACIEIERLRRTLEEDAEKTMLRERIDELKTALRMIMEEKIDYMRINKLGDPEKQHTVKAARAALRDGKTVIWA